MNLLVLIIGILFGAILQSARLNRYNVISGMATLENLTVAKALSVAIGLGASLVAIEVGFGLAAFSVKPLIVGGIALGGIIFGVGMAILGYCPGTMAVSLGEGSLDALSGIFGALTGGLVYTIMLPGIHSLLGPDLGKISIGSLTGGTGFFYYSAVIIIGALLVYLGFVLNKAEKTRDYKWLYAGLGLAVLNAVTMMSGVTNRPIGASTAYPYLADMATGVTQNSYFEKIQTPGNWEVWLLSGAFLSGLVISLVRKEFRLTVIHSNWEKYKGNNATKRLAWAFAGGFLLMIGARMAGGCTSGHILSGGMQLSISSFLFALFVFAGLLSTGKIFYRKQK